MFDPLTHSQITSNTKSSSNLHQRSFWAKTGQIKIHSCVCCFFGSNTINTSHITHLIHHTSSRTSPSSTSITNLQHLQLDLGGEVQQLSKCSNHWNTLKQVQGSSQDHWIAIVITPSQNPICTSRGMNLLFELFNSCNINEK